MSNFEQDYQSPAEALSSYLGEFYPPPDPNGDIMEVRAHIIANYTLSKGDQLPSRELAFRYAILNVDDLRDQAKEYESEELPGSQEFEKRALVWEFAAKKAGEGNYEPLKEALISDSEVHERGSKELGEIYEIFKLGKINAASLANLANSL